ncbi:MAG: ribose 5-phosphate isomerase A [Candidatus Bathyarchaeia archaeon]
MSQFERARKAAAKEAIMIVQDGQTVGLGSGKTMAYAIEELSTRVKEEGLKISVIPTSFQAEVLALMHNLRCISALNCLQRIDIALDGADVVEKRSLNLIKGKGGALTREKIVDSFSKKLIVIIDEGKLVECFKPEHSVPVEVLPFCFKITVERIKGLGGNAVLREALSKVGPAITDNGNFILDVNFGEMKNPYEIDKKLKMIPGVIETGFFLDMTSQVFVGKSDGSVEILYKKT